MARDKLGDRAYCDREERRAHDARLARKRSAAKRARDRREAKPDGRLLDAAVATAVTYLIQRRLPLTRDRIEKCAVAHCVGMHKERSISEAAVAAHLDSRSVSVINATARRVKAGEPDPYVRIAADRQMLVDMEEHGALPAPGASVVHAHGVGRIVHREDRTDLSPAIQNVPAFLREALGSAFA